MELLKILKLDILVLFLLNGKMSEINIIPFDPDLGKDMQFYWTYFNESCISEFKEMLIGNLNMFQNIENDKRSVLIGVKTASIMLKFQNS